MMESPTVLYTASDLNWNIRLRGALSAGGASPRRIESLDHVDQALQGGPATILVVDLEAGRVSIDAIARLRALEAERNDPPALVLAFGPHVNTADLDRAREAGADEALPRGAVLRRLASLFPGGAPPAGTGLA